MLLRVATALAAIVLAASLAACDDDDPPSPTPQPTGPAISATPTPYPDTTTTGVAVVDAAIKAAIAGDANALSAQAQFKSLACVTTPAGPIPAPPQCLANQPAGTLVEAILIGTGESVYRQASELPEVWPNWLGVSRHVYAVKKLATSDELTGAIYHIVFVRADGAGTTIQVSADGIVWIGFDPSFNPRQQAEGPAGTYILPPK
ncbi:MAG: hypothetical protein IH609_10035 [Dehalococcoidia bacterium]|nr:hypothetical protein [Dehalococcoidia bacterium]